MVNDRLYYLTQDLPTFSHVEQVRMACREGVKLLQLRSKTLDYETYEAVAREAVAIAEEYGATLIINDNPSVAIQSRAHGVHLGHADMPVNHARKLLGPNRLIGGTANDFDTVRRLVEEGVDYIGLGPFRFTRTKERLNTLLGIEGVSRVMAQLVESRIDIPVYVIGGIVPADVKDLLKTGVQGVAVSSAVNLAEDREAVLRAFLSATDSVFEKQEKINL